MKKSWVWEHFTETDKNIAECNICHKDIRRIHAGTSSMRSHLLTQHKINDPAREINNAATASDEAEIGAKFPTSSCL